MDVELPPNKSCPKCGAENLATATQCLECEASLKAQPHAGQPILRITDKDLEPVRQRGNFLTQGFLRMMSVPAFAILTGILWPSPEGKGPAAMTAGAAAALLAIVVSVYVETTPFGRRRPAEVWLFLDTLIRGVGCLFALPAALFISIAALALGACYCGAR
jgi:hypothetical protein